MKRFLCGAILFGAVFSIGSCAKGQTPPLSGKESEDSTEGAWQYADTAMGTVVQETVYAEKDIANCFYESSMELLGKLEKEDLSWRLDTSQVYRINASAGEKEGCQISGEMASVLESCLELYERSQGAFDVTLGSLTRLWDIDKWAAWDDTGGFSCPSREAVEQALSLCGSERLRIQRGDGPGSGSSDAKVFLPEGMRLDLGAVGKGVAQSRLRDLLEEETGITGAVISLGGSILTYGVKTDGSPWKVGILDPGDTSSNIGILTLEGGWCVSTSGDYERYVEADGVRYHHILDPATGYPAQSGVRGVTVLVKEGILGDGLSTACFILGPEKGMTLASEYGAESLFVMANGEIILSPGMESYFQEK